MTKQTANSEPCHILVCPFPAFWGHVKTLLAFSCKLLQEQPNLKVTFITMGDFTRQTNIEAERYFLQRDTSLKHNLRIIHLGGEGRSAVDLGTSLQQNFPSLCSALFSTQRSIHSLDGTVYENQSRPDVFVCDVFLLDICNVFRSVSNGSVPVLAWLAPSTGGCLLHIGPEALRGPGDVPSRAKLLAEENGGKATEIEVELRRPTKGDVLHMFDGVKLYDYEMFPQASNEIPHFSAITQLLNNVHQLFMESDGIICASNDILEPEAQKACRDWCREVKKACYVVGPFSLEQDQIQIIMHQLRDANEAGAEVQHFLDKIYASHGRRSLLYVSFGSMAFPTGENIWRVIDVILEMKIPLIFSYDPMLHGEIPSPLKEDLDSSDIALVARWVPQELVIGHDATAWFLSHCGFGSLIESISQGIPIIAFPLVGDETYNAALCSSGLNIAYELFEVRIGVGLKPLYRGAKPTGTPEAITEEVRTVLTKAFGKDGEEKRRNIEELRDKMGTLWKEGGASLNEARRFLMDYLPKTRE